MIKLLEDFFEKEKEYMWKTSSHMKKIYKNRCEKDLETEDRELIIFIVDKLWEKYFDWKMTDDYVDKLLFWLREFLWAKQINNAIENHISYRKANFLR